MLSNGNWVEAALYKQPHWRFSAKIGQPFVRAERLYVYMFLN